MSGKIEPRTTSLRADIAKVIGVELDDSGDVALGNVAANVWRTTHGGGLEGMNLGWADQEASTDFLVGIVDRVEEQWAEMLDEVRAGEAAATAEAWDNRRDRGLDAELADSSVPIGTAERLTVCTELAEYEVGDPGLLPESPTLDQLAGVILYEIADEIIGSLMGQLCEPCQHDSMSWGEVAANHCDACGADGVNVEVEA
jgi:hypothetical protein